MTKARIYQPAKNAMQSGRAGTRRWVLEFEPTEKFNDPLMGWVGSRDTSGQLRLKFESKDEAVEFARRNSLAFEVLAPRERRIKPKNYADNFAFTARLR